MVNEPTVQPLMRHRRQPLPYFHPQLRRTQAVIRRPEWCKRSGERVAHRGSLNTVALVGILFANCFGGGYGFEDAIGSAGPLMTLVFCLVLPWVWGLPTGLAVAELSTSVPSNSGVLMWVNAAFPPTISFLCILGTIMITFVGNATYPSLAAEYVGKITSLNRGTEAAVKIAVVVICCVLNCSGVEIVGSASVIMCGITMTPFMIMSCYQLFTKGFAWGELTFVDFKSIDWAGFLSMISWNYANIENAGAVIEEVANPRKTFTQAMVPLMFSSYIAYVFPMLAGVSAMGPNQDWSQWEAGHWPEVAEKVVGVWLKYMLFGGAIISSIGFTLTSMCCTSRLLAGMGTMQMFPLKLSRIVGYYHPKLGTPIPAILVNSLITMVFAATLDFGNVVALCQSIYCLRLVLVYACVIKLRIDHPNLARPYQLPCNTVVAALCLTPSAMFCIASAITSATTSLAIGLSLVCFLVVGTLVSYLYCRFFAANGFQGVIVLCNDSDDDGEEYNENSSEDEFPIHPGVFYSAEDEGDDHAENDSLLWGLLPIGPPLTPENSDDGAGGTGKPEGGAAYTVDGEPSEHLPPRERASSGRRRSVVEIKRSPIPLKVDDPYFVLLNMLSDAPAPPNATLLNESPRMYGTRDSVDELSGDAVNPLTEVTPADGGAGAAADVIYRGRARRGSSARSGPPLGHSLDPNDGDLPLSATP